MLPATLPDHYATLGVPPGADPRAIKHAYYALMRDHGAHPDKGGDEAWAKRINEAWSVLGHAARRSDYDWERERLKQVLRAESPVDTPEHPCGLDEAQWQWLQHHGELMVRGYQPPGDRACECQRCGRRWITRSFSGMPARCPSCRSKEWHWQRYASCWVCQHAFAVSRLHGPLALTCKACPKCQSRDWSMRPVVVTCAACGTANRARRTAMEGARCRVCRTALHPKARWDDGIRRWVRQIRDLGGRLVDRVVLRSLGSL